MIGIVAALEKRAELWDTHELVNDLYASVRVNVEYRRYDGLNEALQKIEEENRWKDHLRFLIVTYQSFLNGVDLEAGGSISGVSLKLTELKAKYQFKRHKLVVIGVSVNNMFKSALEKAGCDIACGSTNLPSLLTSLAQPGSGPIKLPD